LGISCASLRNRCASQQPPAAEKAPFSQQNSHSPIWHTKCLNFRPQKSINKQSKGNDMKMKKIKLNESRTNPPRRRGFTLVELLLVMTILAILAAITLPRLAGRPGQAQETAAKADIANFATALSAFEVDNGYYPRAADGLQSLMIKPHDAQNTWKGPYLEKNKIPLDPWNHPYVYENPGKHNPASYDVYSNGKDGQGGDYTIGNWIKD
jgi:general secretion pathway protein G